MCALYEDLGTGNDFEDKFKKRYDAHDIDMFKCKNLAFSIDDEFDAISKEVKFVDYVMGPLSSELQKKLEGKKFEDMQKISAIGPMKGDDEEVMEFAMSPDSHADKDGNLMMFSDDLEKRQDEFSGDISNDNIIPSQ